MIISTIPRSEFDRLLPHNSIIENLMVEQVEWFSNASGNLLGAITKGKSEAGWNYGILKRDKEGIFCVHKVTMSFSSLNAARDDLFSDHQRIIGHRIQLDAEHAPRFRQGIPHRAMYLRGTSQ